MAQKLILRIFDRQQKFIHLKTLDFHFHVCFKKTSLTNRHLWLE